MPQHDYDIANQTASAARTDINLALKALASNSSGATAPSTTYANQFWYDTANDQLKQRNEANSAWITLGTVDQTNSKFEPNFTPATNAEALAGTNNTKAMTPLRVKEKVEPVTISSNTLTSVSGSRAFGTVYQNTSASWRVVSARAANNSMTLTVGPTSTPANILVTGSSLFSVYALVPPGWYYKVDGVTLVEWYES